MEPIRGLDGQDAAISEHNTVSRRAASMKSRDPQYGFFRLKSLSIPTLGTHCGHVTSIGTLEVFPKRCLVPLAPPRPPSWCSPSAPPGWLAGLVRPSVSAPPSVPGCARSFRARGPRPVVAPLSPVVHSGKEGERQTASRAHGTSANKTMAGTGRKQRGGHRASEPASYAGGGTTRVTPSGPLNVTDHPQRLQAVSSRH